MLFPQQEEGRIVYTQKEMGNMEKKVRRGRAPTEEFSKVNMLEEIISTLFAKISFYISI